MLNFCWLVCAVCHLWYPVQASAMPDVMLQACCSLWEWKKSSGVRKRDGRVSGPRNSHSTGVEGVSVNTALQSQWKW